VINNRALGGFFFRGINSVSIAGGKVRAAVGSNKEEGDRVFRKEMV
jgi:hypothetical protein